MADLAQETPPAKDPIPTTTSSEEKKPTVKDSSPPAAPAPTPAPAPAPLPVVVPSAPAVVKKKVVRRKPANSNGVNSTAKKSESKNDELGDDPDPVLIQLNQTDLLGTEIHINQPIDKITMAPGLVVLRNDPQLVAVAQKILHFNWAPLSNYLQIRYGYQPPMLTKLFIEFCRFFLLKLVTNNLCYDSKHVNSLIIPPLQIEQAWQAMLLYPSKYASFCNLFFGSSSSMIFDYDPLLSTTLLQKGQKLRLKQFQLTLEVYEKVFGSVPPLAFWGSPGGENIVSALPTKPSGQATAPRKRKKRNDESPVKRVVKKATNEDNGDEKKKRKESACVECGASCRHNSVRSKSCPFFRFMQQNKNDTAITLKFEKKKSTYQSFVELWKEMPESGRKEYVLASEE